MKRSYGVLPTVVIRPSPIVWTKRAFIFHRTGPRPFHLDSHVELMYPLQQISRGA